MSFCRIWFVDVVGCQRGILIGCAQTGLDDLCVRFIINLPHEELQSVERICFQVEEAQWFYEDFIRPLDPSLPSLSLKPFAMRIFQHCPLMSQWSNHHHVRAYDEFMAYRTCVPVRGAILLSEDMEEVVLVKGWGKNRWSFPRGKINKDERDMDCAIREVYEETGFNINETDLAKDEDEVKSIETTTRGQHIRLYVFRGVPRDALFVPRTRKEISEVGWYRLSELPISKKESKQNDQGSAVASASKFYMVASFMHPLKQWIAQQRGLGVKTNANYGQLMPEEEVPTNGDLTPTQMPAEMSGPKSLPQVASSEDATAILKRMLNINGAQEQQSTSEPPQLQPSTSDSSKSNKLLSVLWGNSQPSTDNIVMPPSTPAPIAQPQQSYSLPNCLFTGPHSQNKYNGQADPTTQSGFPNNIQPLYAPPSLQEDFLSRAPSSTINPPIRDNISQPPFSGESPPAAFSYRDGMPRFHPPQTTQMPSTSPHYEDDFVSQSRNFVPFRKHAYAPYQHTADPRFLEHAQNPQVQGATVPAASELPPPKLTSHAQTLLSVLKNESVKPTKLPDSSAMPGSEEKSVKTRKPPHHQGTLFSSHKSEAAKFSSEPAELAAQPVSPGRKQILRRPRDDTKPTNDSVAGAPKGPKGPKGPKEERRAPGMPAERRNKGAIEATTKFPGNKTASGPKRQNNKPRQVENPPSQFTILSRPQATKKKSFNSTDQPTRAPSERRTQKPKTPEPSKPFQPQILRRDDKPKLDSTFPAQPQESKEQGDVGKSDLGSPQNTQLPPIFHILQRAGSGSERATPANDSARNSPFTEVESPSHKNFCLGFLENVAKGNK